MTHDPLAERLRGFGTTIFAEMSALAAATGSINLGQGFPDTEPPAPVADAAVAAIRDGHNQYPPGAGIPELRAAIADHQRHWYGIELDPDREVLVTTGATEAIAAAMISLIDPGDEVVMFEPYYDSYAAAVSMAGGVRRVVPLVAPDWTFDPDAFRAAVTPRTKVLLVNTPHNPTGRILTAEETQVICDLAIERDLLVVTDEVYEHLAYDAPHVPIASLPGMAERTLTISSGGKTFQCTGWKVGWITGPPVLVDAVRTSKQFLTYVSGGPLQYGIAAGLRLGDDYFDGLRNDLRARRDRLAAGLEAVGLHPLTAAGGYFLSADVSAIGATDAREFCLELPERAGLVAIPASVFYDDRARGRTFVRWAFCKRDEVLGEAVARLQRLA
ncbi:MAG: pyridoxal phosphate-dependent aminotransferase [Acidimicrobiales bacterium]